MKLKAPDRYWLLTQKEREKMLNQCGPDGPLNLLIPNHLMGADISESCNIHDFMYIKAESKSDLREADRVFLDNMMTQVENGSKFSRFGRKMLAYFYYGAVRAYSWFRSSK